MEIGCPSFLDLYAAPFLGKITVMQVPVQLVKAFTADKSQGNPAGVVLHADKLNDKQMLHIAAELGFSESAFVQASTQSDFRVRFFSVKRDVDFCGHATIATFHTLMEHRKVLLNGKTQVTVKQETRAGILPVTCYEDGRVVMSQNDPTFGYIESDKSAIAALLNVDPTAIMDTPIQLVSTGTPKLMIPIVSLKEIRNIQPDLSGISEYCRRHEVKGLYPFTAETLEDSSHFYARQFNPLAGINEDPITGIAAGALGCYAEKYNLVTDKRIIVEQGYGMSMGGEMYVDISDGVKVGGYAVTYGERAIVL